MLTPSLKASEHGVFAVSSYEAHLLRLADPAGTCGNAILAGRPLGPKQGCGSSPFQKLWKNLSGARQTAMDQVIAAQREAATEYYNFMASIAQQETNASQIVAFITPQQRVDMDGVRREWIVRMNDTSRLRLFCQFPLNAAPEKRLTYGDFGVHQMARPRASGGNEDVWFHKQVGDVGVLFGMFDGHVSGSVSVEKRIYTYLKDRFPEVFVTKLQEAGGDALTALKEAFKGLNDEIEAHRDEYQADDQGATAVVVYIDKRTNKAYTATMGDSLALLIRGGEDFGILPLSKPLSWKSPKELDRLVIDTVRRYADETALSEGFVHRMRVILREKILNAFPNDKELRSWVGIEIDTVYCAFSNRGLNVSRCFGDLKYATLKRSPKITCIDLLPNDRIVVGSDGVFDEVDMEQLGTYLRLHPELSSQELANGIVRLALHSRSEPDDDTTACVLKVEEQS